MSSEKVILVTGGTGFAGQHLLTLLKERETCPVHATSYSDHEAIADVSIHQVDLTVADQVRELFEKIKPTQVYHLASMAVTGNSFEKAHTLLQNNLELQLNLLETVQKYCPQTKVLVVSSAEVYMPSEQRLTETDQLQPLNPYGLSKALQDLAAQMYHLSYGLQIVRARAFNHTGPGQSDNFVIPAFASQIVAIERGTLDVLSVGNLKAIRDFSDVRDIVKGYHLMMEQAPPGEVYNIGSGEETSLEVVLEKLLSLSETSITVQPDSSRMRPSDVPYKVADIIKLAALGWSPQIKLDQTLQDVIKYWREQT